MLTLNPVLQVGAYDWTAQPLSQSEFEARVSALREVMAERGWSGVAVFGDRQEHGSLCYFTNFVPRLAAALALIPLEGDIRVMTFDGGRMVPAAKLTTWVKNVEPSALVEEKLSEWRRQLNGSGRLALAEFAMVPSGVGRQIGDATDDADDATEAIHDLRRGKSAAEVDLIRSCCRILSDAAKAFSAAALYSADVDDCAAKADRAAIRAGAQDVRILVSPDTGQSFAPYEEPYSGPPRPAVAYIAVRHRGYWVDGFLSGVRGSTVQSTVDQAMGSLLEIIAPGTSTNDLSAVRDRFFDQADLHQVIGHGFGAGLGMSLQERPVLDGDTSIELVAGDVISLRLGIYDVYEGALCSRIVNVTDEGCEVLWSGNQT